MVASVTMKGGIPSLEMKQAYDQGCDDRNPHVPAIVHHADTDHGAAGCNNGADAQVDVTGQYAQQHTDSQNDDVAVLHDQVVDVRRRQVLAAGQNRKNNINRYKRQYHAVLSHINIDNFIFFHDYAPFLLSAIIQPIIFS